MKDIRKILGGALGVAVTFPAVVSAQAIDVGIGIGIGVGTPAAVPEIDASSGAMALAALGAAMLLVWEINRRRRTT